MPGQVEVRDVRWEPETKAMPADGPTAKSRPGPETSDVGCRSDMRRRSPNRREWPIPEVVVKAAKWSVVRSAMSRHF